MPVPGGIQPRALVLPPRPLLPLRNVGVMSSPIHPFAPRGWARHVIGPAASRAGNYQRGVQHERDFRSALAWKPWVLCSLLLPFRHALSSSLLDFALTSMDAPGIEKCYVIYLHDVFYTNPHFLGSHVFVLIPSSQQPAPGSGVSPPTGVAGQIANHFVWVWVRSD